MCRLPTEKKKTCRFSESSCSLRSAPAPPGVAATLKVPIYVYSVYMAVKRSNRKVHVLTRMCAHTYTHASTRAIHLICTQKMKTGAKFIKLGRKLCQEFRS